MQEIDRGNIDNRGFNFPNFGITGILRSLKDQFKYRGATEEAWDPNTGQFISAEEQDKQNALGGYYSDAARHQRRQRARVVNMMRRRDANQTYSEKNLRELKRLGYGPDETTSPNVHGGGSEATFTQTSPGGISQATSRAARTDQHGNQMGGWRLAEGGRIGLYKGGDPTEWMTEQEAITPFQLQQEEGVPIGPLVSDEFNDKILDNLYNKYIDQGFSPTDAEKMALEEFELMSQGSEQDEGLASLV